MTELSDKSKKQLAEIQEDASYHMNRIQGILPLGYKLTLVARHPDIPNAQVILSDDPDREAVAEALLKGGTFDLPGTGDKAP